MKLNLNHYALITIVAMAGIFLAIAYFAPPSVPRIREYTGVLQSITYNHQGWFHSISSTVLHFEDHDFTLKGNHVYQLGQTYHVVYELFSNSDKVWKVHSVDLVEVEE